MVPGVGRPWHGEHNEVPERDVSFRRSTTLGTNGTWLVLQRSRGRIELPVVIISTFVDNTSQVRMRSGSSSLICRHHPGPSKLLELWKISRKVRSISRRHRPVSLFNESTGDVFGVMVRTSPGGTSRCAALVATTVRSIPASLRLRGMDERQNQRLDVSTPILGVAGGRIRRDGITSWGGRTLRGGCVFGEPANTGDWSSHGSRRSTWFGLSAYFKGGGVVDCRGGSGRSGMFGGRGDTDSRAACLRWLVGRTDAGGRSGVLGMAAILPVRSRPPRRVGQSGARCAPNSSAVQPCRNRSSSMNP